MEISDLEAVETVESVPLTQSKQTINCDSFSDDNYNVTVSSCKQSVKGKLGDYGYCFLNNPKWQKNQILKWSLRVPKHNYGRIGMFIIPE